MPSSKIPRKFPRPSMRCCVTLVLLWAGDERHSRILRSVECPSRRVLSCYYSWVQPIATRIALKMVKPLISHDPTLENIYHLDLVSTTASATCLQNFKPKLL